MDPFLVHILNNFSLYGFSSHEMAMFQAGKELIDNSIDSLRRVDGNTGGQIKVEIRSTMIRDGALDWHADRFINLVVSDTGCGMGRDPSQFLKAFVTDKSWGTTTSGRFGMGLSLSLIYSLHHAMCSMRIQTKTKDMTVSSISDFALDHSTGFPKTLQQFLSDDETLRESGTKVKLTLPAISEEDAKRYTTRIQLQGAVASVVNQVVINLEKYISRLALIPLFQVNFEIDIDLPHFSYFVTKSGIDHEEPSDKEAEETLEGESEAETESYSKKVEKKMQKYKFLQGQIESLAVGIACRKNLKVYVTMVLLDRIKDDAVKDLHREDNEEFTLPITLYRYMNSTPLLDDGPEALSCGIVASIRKINWNSFGYKLKIDLSDDVAVPTKNPFISPSRNAFSTSDKTSLSLNTSSPSFYPSTSSSTSSSSSSSSSTSSSSSPSIRQQSTNASETKLSLLQPPPLVLVGITPKHTALQENQSTSTMMESTRMPSELLILIDAVMDNCPYSTMRKTSLLHDEAMKESIILATQSAMTTLKHLSSYQIFDSAEDWKSYKATSLYIPTVARAIGKMALLTGVLKQSLRDLETRSRRGKLRIEKQSKGEGDEGEEMEEDEVSDEEDEEDEEVEDLGKSTKDDQDVKRLCSILEDRLLTICRGNVIKRSSRNLKGNTVANSQGIQDVAMTANSNDDKEVGERCNTFQEKTGEGVRGKGEEEEEREMMDFSDYDDEEIIDEDDDDMNLYSFSMTTSF